MKHLKSFNESNFKDLLSDQMDFGTDDIKDNAVYLDKLESSWGEDEGYYEGSKEYVLYFGPCDRDGLSDGISFTDEFLNSMLRDSGATRYHLHSAENSHTLYFDNNQEADIFYNELKDVVGSYGYQIIGDN